MSKTKILVTITIAILLIAMVPMLRVTSIRADGPVYKYLIVAYSPCPMVNSIVPVLFPAVGQHEETLGSVVDVFAPELQPVCAGMRYKFDNWFIHDDELDTTTIDLAQDIHVTMNHNFTVTAVYDLEYRLTVSNYNVNGATAWEGAYLDSTLTIKNGTESFAYAKSDTTVEVMNNTVQKWAYLCGSADVESFQHAYPYAVLFEVGLVNDKLVKLYEYENTPVYLFNNGIFMYVAWTGAAYEVGLKDHTSHLACFLTAQPAFDFQVAVITGGTTSGTAYLTINDGSGWKDWAGGFSFSADLNQAYLFKDLYEEDYGGLPVCNTTFTGTAEVYLWIQTNQSWFNAGGHAYVALSGLAYWGNNRWGYWDNYPDRFYWLISWDCAATGLHTQWSKDCGYWYYSDPILMGGQYCTNLIACPNWAGIYWLEVDTGTPPPLTNPPSGAEGYYDQGTIANLTAPYIHPTWIIPNVARWVFDHWELDGVTVANSTLIWTADNATLKVLMDTNHTAIDYYVRQSFVTKDDNIGELSGFNDTGNWYYDCHDYTFAAPQYVYSGCTRYRFFCWDQLCGGVHSYFGDSRNYTLILHIDPSWDGQKLVAVYQGQSYVKVNASAGVPDPGFLYPDSDTSGYYDWGSTMNLKARPDITFAVQDIDTLMPAAPDNEARWHFVKWQWEGDGSTTANNFTSGPIYICWNVTAVYDLQYLMSWDSDPTGLIPGWPNSAWVNNNTMFLWDVTPYSSVGVYVFDHWTIDFENTTVKPYDSGVNPVFTLVLGPMDGIAYYLNETEFYLTPFYVERNAHSEGYCTEFNVTVMAANFDADRIYLGQSMAIYAMDFKVNFDPTRLQISHVYLNSVPTNTENVNGFWNATEAPQGSFVAKNITDNVNGYYWLSASVKGNNTGFEGTRWVVILTFHIIYSPCYLTYPYGLYSWIYISGLTLMNNNGTCGTQISPESTHDTLYYIYPPQPIIELKDAKDGDNDVTVHRQQDPQGAIETFDVEVWLDYGIRVTDFSIQLHYDATQLGVLGVTMGTYLKPPFAYYAWLQWTIGDDGYVAVEVEQEGPPQGAGPQNCSGVLFTVKFKVIQGLTWTQYAYNYLNSMITVVPGSSISVMCPSPGDIYLGGQPSLGTIPLSYTYNSLPGDVNHDGKVNVLDLQAVADHYHPPAAYDPNYDLDNNGWVNIRDLVVVALNYGKQALPQS